MKRNCLIVLTLVTATLADIGEKLRLGQSIKAVPQNNFNIGLQAPFSTNQNAVGVPRATNHSDEEDNLDRLCNDPFHSFLCESVGPRKNTINGQLRPGAQIPANVFTGASTNQNESKQKPLRTGVKLLAAVIQPSSSFDSSRVSAAVANRNQYLPPGTANQQSQPTQQFITKNVNPARPSNEYLPSNSQPVPLRKDNVQFSLPLEQQQQNIYRYSAPPTRPNTFISPSTKSPPFQQQTQFPTSISVANPIQQSPQTVRTTVKPITTPLFTPSTVRPIARPSNQYLPIVEPIDIRNNPSSTNLSPLIQGNRLLAAVRQSSSTEIPQPKKQERQHTLEELCNDAFHSFLCKPITKPRKRIDGRIRPGAKIPPHILQGADTFGTSARKLAPLKEGTKLLAQGRVAQNTPQGYFYPKPQNNPFLDTQATNQKSVQNVLLKDNLPPIPERIPPPGAKAPIQNSFTKNQFVIPQVTNRPTSQRPIQNFQFQGASQAQIMKTPPTPTVFKDNLPPIPERIPPPVLSNQNLFPSNQYREQQIPVSRPTTRKPIQNFQSEQNLFSTARFPSTTSRPKAFNSQFPTISTTTPRPNQFFQITQSLNRNNARSKTQVGNYVFPKPAFPQNPIAAPAQISSQSQPLNTVNQITSKNSNGYQYPKPSTTFTYPTTTRRPLTTLNLLYIPSEQQNFTANLKTSQNQIITNTQRPVNLASTTSSYAYPKPSIAFTLPTVTTTTPRYVAPTVTSPQQTAIPSNNRPIVTASKPFSQNIATGYQYPKPVQPFTLPTTTAKSIVQGGYTYPRPAKAFTLPPRNGLANTQAFGTKTSFPTLQTFNQFSIPVNNVINGDTINDDALPPASQFEILKP